MNYRLIVSRFVLSKTMKRIQEYLQVVETLRLRQVVDVTHPPHAQRAENMTGTLFPMLTIRDIPGEGYVLSPTGEALITDNHLQRINQFLLQPLDILISPRIGPRINTKRVGLVSPRLNEKWLPSHTMFILRLINENADMAHYLFMYLRSEIGQELLDSIAMGTVIRRILRSDLQELLIPVPSPKELAAVNATFEEEVSLFDKITALEEEKNLLVKRHWAV
jgi:type I restriction enzyme M protein